MRSLALAMALMVGACESATAPDIEAPPHAIPYDAPAWYADWYDAMAECADRPGDFGRVRWFIVPGEGSWLDGNGVAIHGAWVPPHDVYLSAARTTDRELIEHHMAHEIVQNRAHPSPPFGGCSSPESH